MGPCRRRLLAFWNQDRDIWESTAIDLFSGLPDVYSETLPSSGMTRGGRLYVLQTSELPTGEQGSSSLLPTPTANLGINGGSQNPAKRRAGGHSPNLADVIEKS